MQRLSQADYRALAGFRHQLRRFLHFSEAAARKAGVEPRQHQLLLAIKGLERGRRPVLSVLAERLQLRHNSTVELVDRCEARGLVERLAHATDDSREVLLRLTPQGEQVLAMLSTDHHRELADLGPRLISALSHFLAPRAVVTKPGARRAAAARRPQRTHRKKGIHAKPRR